MPITCVRNDDDLHQLALGPDGVPAHMRPGSILIDNTTASAYGRASYIRRPASWACICWMCGLRYQAGADNGKVMVMVGGDAESFVRAEPVIAAYARAVAYMGIAGSGQLTKMVNQTCVVGMA